MASLYKKTGSPFWYLRYRDSDGKWRHQSTGLRHGVDRESRKARVKEAEATMRENSTTRVSPEWSRWVPAWIESHFAEEASRRRANSFWRVWTEFLTERDLRNPGQIDRVHLTDYHIYRTKGHKRKKVRNNTALAEIKLFIQILNEAIDRGYITTNPGQRLKLSASPAREKAPFTDDQITIIRAECDRLDDMLVKDGKKPWMRRCFEVGIHHGVRLHETKVPMADVDLDANLIVFNNSKRKKKPFGAHIHPGLKPMLEQWKKNGDAFTCEPPSSASVVFHKMFRRLKMKACFHCTRVTVATRLALNGVDERIAKLYLNHSSSLVHSIYVKLRPEHAAGVAEALSYPDRELDKSV